MSWIWPRKLNDDRTILVRVGRLLHWCFVGFAVMLATLAIVTGILDRHGEPIFYITTALVWFGFAVLGRGVRYLLARE